MDTEFLQTIITGAPNFVGFILALVILYRRLGQQDKTIAILIDKWSNCEDDSERSKIANLRNGATDSVELLTR